MPRMIRDPRFHRGSDAERLVDAAEVQPQSRTQSPKQTNVSLEASVAGRRYF